MLMYCVKIVVPLQSNSDHKGITIVCTLHANDTLSECRVCLSQTTLRNTSYFSRSAIYQKLFFCELCLDE